MAGTAKTRWHKVDGGVRAGDTQRSEIDNLVLPSAAGLGLAQLIDRPTGGK